MSRKTTTRKRPTRSRRLVRWLVPALVALVAFLYYRPVSSYLDVRADLEQRRAEVRELRSERARLERRLAEAGSGASLVRSARRLGLVKPGERLYIVKGIPEWRQARRR